MYFEIQKKDSKNICSTVKKYEYILIYFKNQQNKIIKDSYQIVFRSL